MTSGPDVCEPCKCVNPGIGSIVLTYRLTVVKILCQILEAVGGGGFIPGSTFISTGTNVAAGAGATKIFNSKLQQALTLTVKPHDGSTTAWSVNIEVSLNGTDWFPVANLTEASGVVGSTISVSGLAATDARYNVVSTDGHVDVVLQGVSL